MNTQKEKTPRDASRTIANKRKELFCELYSFEFWGRAAEAASKAGYQVTERRVRELLGDPEIRERIRFLRKQLAEQTVADEAWIQKNFVDIAMNADKASDKLRALATLYRAVMEKEKPAPLSGGEPESFPELSFEGEEDGSL